MELEAAVAELFPPFVAVAVAPAHEDYPSRHGEEMELVARAVARRRREFLSGRFSAHRALRAIDLDDGPILVGPRREPLWPPGAVGSIAHAGEWSVAVAARAGDARSLGVDLEMLEPRLEAAVDRLVRTPAERKRHPGAGKLVFSVKESVYKTLFPLTGQALEFEEVDVALDFANGAFAADVGPTTVTGRFTVVGGYVVSGVCLS
jgi:4'-phosphopantetheinyl transferase EntD